MKFVYIKKKNAQVNEWANEWVEEGGMMEAKDANVGGIDGIVWYCGSGRKSLKNLFDSCQTVKFTLQILILQKLR